MAEKKPTVLKTYFGDTVYSTTFIFENCIYMLISATKSHSNKETPGLRACIFKCDSRDEQMWHVAFKFEYILNYN